MSDKKCYTFIIESAEPESGFTGSCVELPGVISQGETVPETLTNLAEAFALIVERAPE